MSVRQTNSVGPAGRQRFVRSVAPISSGRIRPTHSSGRTTLAAPALRVRLARPVPFQSGSSRLVSSRSAELLLERLEDADAQTMRPRVS